MDYQILVGAAATVLGVIVTQVFAMKIAETQAKRADRREALQWDREQASKRDRRDEELARELREREDQKARELRSKREEFLALVLLTHERLVDYAWMRARAQAEIAKSETESASGSARRAYALALIYLNNDMKVLAHNFYKETVDMDLVLQKNDRDNFGEAVDKWRAASDKVIEYFWMVEKKS